MDGLSKTGPLFCNPGVTGCSESDNYERIQARMRNAAAWVSGSWRSPQSLRSFIEASSCSR